MKRKVIWANSSSRKNFQSLQVVLLNASSQWNVREKGHKLLRLNLTWCSSIIEAIIYSITEPLWSCYRGHANHEVSFLPYLTTIDSIHVWNTVLVMALIKNISCCVQEVWDYNVCFLSYLTTINSINVWKTDLVIAWTKNIPCCVQEVSDFPSLNAKKFYKFGELPTDMSSIRSTRNFPQTWVKFWKIF